MQYLALTLPGGQTVTPPSGVPSGGIDVIAKIVANAITIMMIIAVILSLFYLIIGGMQWISSGGDKAKVASARSRIMYAIICLVVAMAAFFLVSIIGYFFQVNLLQIG